MSEDQVEVVAEAPREEYASQTLVLDHLYEGSQDGDTKLKVVFSTESAVESLLSQLNYLGMVDQLKSAGVIDLIAAGNKNAAVYVVDVPERGQHRGQTNIIVDAAVWSDPALSAQVNPEGTVLGFHASLIAMAMDILRTGKEQAPGHRVFAWVSGD